MSPMPVLFGINTWSADSHYQKANYSVFKLNDFHVSQVCRIPLIWDIVKNFVMAQLQIGKLRLESLPKEA